MCVCRKLRGVFDGVYLHMIWYNAPGWSTELANFRVLSSGCQPKQFWFNANKIAQHQKQRYSPVYRTVNQQFRIHFNAVEHLENEHIEQAFYAF